MTTFLTAILITLVIYRLVVLICKSSIKVIESLLESLYQLMIVYSVVFSFVVMTLGKIIYWLINGYLIPELRQAYADFCSVNISYYCQTEDDTVNEESSKPVTEDKIVHVTDDWVIPQNADQLLDALVTPISDWITPQNINQIYPNQMEYRIRTVLSYMISQQLAFEQLLPILSDDWQKLSVRKLQNICVQINKIKPKTITGHYGRDINKRLLVHKLKQVYCL